MISLNNYLQHLKFASALSNCWGFCQGKYIFPWNFSENCLNNTHIEKLCFYSIQCKNDYLAASDFFHIFTQSIKFHTFYYHVWKSKDVWKMCSSNRQQKWMVASFSKFYRKILVGFCLKDTQREKAPSNKTTVVMKSINMDIWVVGTSNQLFLKDPQTETKFSKK